MTLSRDLRTAVEEMVQKAIRNLHYDATLGKGDEAKTLFVAGRPNFVWARVGIPTPTIQVVRCTKVTPAYGLQVRVWHDHDNVLSVASQDDSQAEKFYGGRVVGNAGPHNQSHGYFGMDPVLLDGRQFLPLLCQPNSPQDLSVRVRSCILYDADGGATAFAGGNIDLTAHVPSSANEQRIVIVGLNIGSNTLTATLGSIKTVAALDTTNIPFSDAEAAAIDVSSAVIPIMAIRLFNGQTQITPHDLFKDMRPYFTLPWLTSGSESGGESGADGVLPGYFGGRLTPTSGEPVPTANATGVTTLYCAPTDKDMNALDVGYAKLFNTTSSLWETHTWSEISASVPSTSDSVHDVFFSHNSGSDVYELTFSGAWTNDTTRSTALGDEGGIKVQAADHSKLWIGIIKTTSVSGETESSVLAQNGKRFIVNKYNQVELPLWIHDNDTFWQTMSTNYEAYNTSTDNKASYIYINNGHAVWMRGLTSAFNSGGSTTIGIGLDSTSVNSAQLHNNSGGARESIGCEGWFNPAEGAHANYGLQRVNASTATIYGIAASGPQIQTGFVGHVRG